MSARPVCSDFDLIDLTFCPGGEVERAHRRAIMKARDIALLRAGSDRPDPVRAVYWQLVELAQEWLAAPASVDALWQTRKALTRLYQAASEWERLEARHG
jgi:hypothetical protein